MSTIGADNRLWSLLPASLLALTHIILATPLFSFTWNHRKSTAWASVAGGVSVSYIFVQLIPELVNNNQVVSEEFPEEALASRYVFFAAFTGFSLFYSMEAYVMRHRLHKETVDDEDRENIMEVFGNEWVLPRAKKTWLYWLSLSTFALSNIVVGSLLPSRITYFGYPQLALYWLATETLYIVSDLAAKNHFPRRYNNYGKWILFTATFIGWFIGYFLVLPRFIVPLVSASLAGTTILVVIKEHLPSTKGEPRIGLFLLCATISAVVFLFV